MQPVLAIVPEFDGTRDHAETGPTLGAGNVAALEPGSGFADFRFELRAAFKRLGLL